MTNHRMAISCIIIVFLQGCSSSSSPSAKTAPASKPSESRTAPSVVDDAENFAREFVLAVQAGNARASDLSPDFKKLIARPVFPSEKELGYSDVAAGEWLKRFTDKIGSQSMTLLEGTEDAPSFIGQGWLLRLTKSEPRKVEWFAVGPTVSSPGFKGSQVFTALAFMNALLSKNDHTAAICLAPALRSKIAPPFSSDKDGYNHGLLSQRLASLRGTATLFTIRQVDGDTIKAEWHGTDTRRGITLKLSKGPKPLDYLIEDYQLD